MIEVWTGSLYGSVRALDGNVRSIRVFNGDIGQPNQPSLIEASAYSAIWQSHMWLLEVAGNVWANIDSNTSTTDADGIVNKVQIGGNLGGTFEAGEYKDFSVLGNLNGTLIHGLNLPSTRTMKIGGSLGASGSIDIPEDGLQGQIILNSQNGSGQWNGTISVGDIDLTSDGYAELATDLGGGSVGLAPFALHDESCDPPNGTVLTADVPDEVRLRHYGGILLGTGDPITIEKRCAALGGSWTNVTSDFVWSIDSQDSRSLIVEPDTSAPGFEVGYEYRIEPTADLRCSDVDSSPSVGWDGAYLLTLGNCPDLTSDGEVGVPDLLALLACWGPVTTQPCEAADLTGDDEVGVPDLLLLLAAWGDCESCSRGAPEKEVEDCFDRYEPGSPELEECLEWVRDFGSFWEGGEEEM